MFRKLVAAAMVLFCLAAVSPAMAAEDEAWLYGKWELSYDPDGAKTDYLEFLPNGDAWSIGPKGKVPGFYIVDGDTVKAVFTWKAKDLITIFHADRQNKLLKIVTSRSGKESIYKKVIKP